MVDQSIGVSEYGVIKYNLRRSVYQILKWAMQISNELIEPGLINNFHLGSPVSQLILLLLILPSRTTLSPSYCWEMS